MYRGTGSQNQVCWGFRERTKDVGDPDSSYLKNLSGGRGKTGSGQVPQGVTSGPRWTSERQKFKVNATNCGASSPKSPPPEPLQSFLFCSPPEAPPSNLAQSREAPRTDQGHSYLTPFVLHFPWPGMLSSLPSSRNSTHASRPNSHAVLVALDLSLEVTASPNCSESMGGCYRHVFIDRYQS